MFKGVFLQLREQYIQCGMDLVTGRGCHNSNDDIQTLQIGSLTAEAVADNPLQPVSRVSPRNGLLADDETQAGGVHFILNRGQS